MPWYRFCIVWTDGIYITNPKGKFKNKKDIKFKTNRICDRFITDSKLVYFEKHYRENFNMEDYHEKLGKGRIFSGGADCGKTTRLVKMVNEVENAIVLSFTNEAIENVKEQLINPKNNANKKYFTYMYQEVNKICLTLIVIFVNGKGEI